METEREACVQHAHVSVAGPASCSPCGPLPALVLVTRPARFGSAWLSEAHRGGNGMGGMPQIAEGRGLAWHRAPASMEREPDL